MKSEVPKYKMITPSILADRLRVGAVLCITASHLSLRPISQNKLASMSWHLHYAEKQVLVQINGSLARAAIKELLNEGAIRIVAKHSKQEIFTRATNTEA